MSRYEDKVVIVTGGAQGIGMAITKHYGEEGAQVIIADVDIEAGMELQEKLLEKGCPCHYIQTDVGIEASVMSLMEQVGSTYGKIDILINNAAIPFSKDIETRSMEEWHRALAVNLTGPYMCVKYGLPHMKNRNASIINMASTRAFMSEVDTEPYSASKGGIISLTHSLALSLSKYKIRVNAISPGWIDVSQWQKSSNRKQVHLSATDHNQHPAGRVGTPEDIAKACLFLTSEDAGFITGANFIIDGGMTVKMIYSL